MRGKAIEEDVVRGILMAKGSTDDIAAAHDVSRSTVYQVKRLVTPRARAVAQALRDEGVEPQVWAIRRKKHHFTPAQIAYIRESPKNATEIAEEAACSASLIRMIRTGKAYR